MWYRVAGLTMIAAFMAAPPASSQNLPARSPLTGSTPAECVRQANAWRTREVTRLRAESKPIDALALLNEARRLAAECGSKFSVESAPSAQLVELAALYNYAGDTAGARAAVARALAATDLTQRQHADMVLLAISNALAVHDAFAGACIEAESLADQLEALPDSLADRKLRAHQLLLGRYGYGDYDDGIREHAQAMLELGRRLGDRNVIVNSVSELARAAGDYLRPDSALRIMDLAEREVGAPAGSLFPDPRARYGLVGTPAAPVTAEVWLNADTPPAAVAMGDGKLRMIQFTAHWCAPCRNSYPGMLRLAKRFEGRQFEVVFVTELYGNFEGKPATEAEELAADRVYYAKHGIPFRIAINRIQRNAAAPPGTRSPLVNQQYAVGGIPQIVVVDQRGVIRQIVIGWDHGNEQRLGAYIEKLLGSTAQ